MKYPNPGLDAFLDISKNLAFKAYKKLTSVEKNLSPEQLLGPG